MFWIYTLVVLLVLLAVLLVLAVMIQNSKGGGLANTAGAAGVSQVFGARRGADFVERATWTLMGGLVVITFLINIAFSTVSQPAAQPQGLDIDGVAPAAQAPAQLPGLNDLQQAPTAPAPAQPDSISK